VLPLPPAVGLAAEATRAVWQLPSADLRSRCHRATAHEVHCNVAAHLIALVILFHLYEAQRAPPLAPLLAAAAGPSVPPMAAANAGTLAA
jgi:hypothetical protein